MTVVAGIDPSYSCTAVVVLRDGSFADSLRLKLPEEEPPARLVFVRDKVRSFLSGFQPELVAIEGYAHGAKFGREQAGELGGILRVTLWEELWPYVVVAPPTLKKWVTGKGVAEKSLILREVYKKWGFDAEDDNLADAFALAKLAGAMKAPERTKTFSALMKKLEVIGG